MDPAIPLKTAPPCPLVPPVLGAGDVDDGGQEAGQEAPGTDLEIKV